jgi:hypothetical protein
MNPMNPMNPWKLATIGMSLVGITALSTGVTTAYFMGPNTEPVVQAAPAAVAAAPQAFATPAVHYAAAQPTYVAQPAPRPVVRPAPRVVRTATVAAAPDCVTTGDRVWRIAKPGAVGGLLGAGLGAVGGAIADGGKAAGKGALIGGLAGAVLGGGYGAYKTKQECGTVLGNTFGASPAVYAAR